MEETQNDVELSEIKEEGSLSEGSVKLNIGGTIQNPRKLGNLYAFCYSNHNPLFVIGGKYKFTFIFIGICLMASSVWVSIIPRIISFKIMKAEIFLMIFSLITIIGTFIKNPGIPNRRRMTQVQSIPKYN